MFMLKTPHVYSIKPPANELAQLLNTIEQNDGLLARRPLEDQTQSIGFDLAMCTKASFGHLLTLSYYEKAIDRKAVKQSAVERAEELGIDVLDPEHFQPLHEEMLADITRNTPARQTNIHAFFVESQSMLIVDAPASVINSAVALIAKLFSKFEAKSLVVNDVRRQLTRELTTSIAEQAPFLRHELGDYIKLTLHRKPKSASEVTTHKQGWVKSAVLDQLDNQYEFTEAELLGGVIQFLFNDHLQFKSVKYTDAYLQRANAEGGELWNAQIEAAEISDGQQRKLHILLSECEFLVLDFAARVIQLREHLGADVDENQQEAA